MCEDLHARGGTSGGSFFNRVHAAVADKYTRTGDQLRTVQNQFTKEVTSVSFVADDMVVACGGDSKVRFINAANGNNQRDFSGPTEYMYSVAASADGKTILAGGLDSILRIWNDQGQELAKFAAPPWPSEKTAAK